ncbi:MAG: hypothetical protein ACYDAJ_12210 [Nitrosotalea sp.]
MTEFSFQQTFGFRESRCGWCLDYIIKPLGDIPASCPYCGASLSSKNPRYDEFMAKINNDSELRKRDNLLREQRLWQYRLKTLNDQKLWNALPPLLHKVRPMWPIGPGTMQSWGRPLMTLLEKLHTTPNAPDVETTKEEIRVVGKECYMHGGIDQMRFDFDSAVDELLFKHTPDFDKYRVLWNGICEQWKY